MPGQVLPVVPEQVADDEATNPFGTSPPILRLNFEGHTGIIRTLDLSDGGRTLVSADAENWVVNAAISSCVLLAFVGIFVLNALKLNGLALYVDPTVVLAVVAISIAVPVRMSWNALMALMNRAPSSDILTQVTDIVDASLVNLPVQERFIRVIQPGRQRMVLVHVVLPTDYEPGRLPSLDVLRTHTYQALREAHVATIVDMLFTTDRRWGAPLSDGGFGGPL